MIEISFVPEFQISEKDSIAINNLVQNLFLKLIIKVEIILNKHHITELLLKKMTH